MPQKEGVIRLQFTADEKAGTIEGKLLPKLKRNKPQNIKPYLNAMLSSVNLGLTAILADLPVMRPASEVEVSAKVYIFKEGDKDNALYQTRKSIHDAIARVFEDTLNNLFPDVRFIASTVQYQQDTVLEMSEEEVKDHKRFIEALAEEVKTTEE